MSSAARALARELEVAVCEGRPDAIAVVRPLLDRLGDTSPGVAFAAGRVFEEEGEAEAAALLFRHAAGYGGEAGARASAHLAHVEYYRGRFDAGLAQAMAVAKRSTGLARAEGLLYASVNLIALNRSREAKSTALASERAAQRVRDPRLRAELRFRIARQLVHVTVARGAYTDARSAAEQARSYAARLKSDRHQAIAAYLVGYTLYARGDARALMYFREADGSSGGSQRALGRWIQFVWAMALRDLGQATAAHDLRTASGITLSWEDPLFDLAEARDTAKPIIDGMPHDEIPFRQAAAGVVTLAQGDALTAARLLRAAHREFERSELDHFRRGVALNLAYAYMRLGEASRATRILQSEAAALVRHGIRRWPWWHEPIARKVARFAMDLQIIPDHWRSVVSGIGAEIDAPELLRARGLSEREISVVRTWLEHSQWDRSRLAREVGVSEATLRNHLNSIRSKLDCGPRRGAEAISAALDARSSGDMLVLGGAVRRRVTART